MRQASARDTVLSGNENILNVFKAHLLKPIFKSSEKKI